MNCLVLPSQSRCPQTAASWGRGGRARSRWFRGLAEERCGFHSPRETGLLPKGVSAFCPAIHKSISNSGVSAQKSGEIFPNPGQRGMPEVPGTKQDLADMLRLEINKHVIRIKVRNRITERKTR